MILLGGFYSISGKANKNDEIKDTTPDQVSSIPAGTKLVTIKTHTYAAELAATPEEREKGLSGRQSLAQDVGMLFVFDTPDQYGFWMKDTLIPLDIIWIGEDKRIVHIEKNIEPSTYPTTFQPENDALYVLELNAGQAEKNFFAVGDEVSFSTAE